MDLKVGYEVWNWIMYVVLNQMRGISFPCFLFPHPTSLLSVIHECPYFFNVIRIGYSSYKMYLKFHKKTILFVWLLLFFESFVCYTNASNLKLLLEKEIIRRKTAIERLDFWPGLFCCVYEDCNFAKSLLICENSTCVCPHDYQFGGGIFVNMEWNNEIGKCVSKIGSACDVEHTDSSGIGCVHGAICEQIKELPNGMGRCVNAS
ncbi:unnamed protein product [Orchesella dallaii]|uniref:EB domain-containing protein n=1 Tax=Orchesella dallaii TaxID=48710 RepID=A0ABP1S3V2_9HEXA